MLFAKSYIRNSVSTSRMTTSSPEFQTYLTTLTVFNVFKTFFKFWSRAEMSIYTMWCWSSSSIVEESTGIIPFFLSQGDLEGLWMLYEALHQPAWSVPTLWKCQKRFERQSICQKSDVVPTRLRNPVGTAVNGVCRENLPQDCKSFFMALIGGKHRPQLDSLKSIDVLREYPTTFRTVKWGCKKGLLPSWRARWRERTTWPMTSTCVQIILSKKSSTHAKYVTTITLHDFENSIIIVKSNPYSLMYPEHHVCSVPGLYW